MLLSLGDNGPSAAATNDHRLYLLHAAGFYRSPARRPASIAASASVVAPLRCTSVRRKGKSRIATQRHSFSGWRWVIAEPTEKATGHLVFMRIRHIDELGESGAVCLWCLWCCKKDTECHVHDAGCAKCYARDLAFDCASYQRARIFTMSPMKELAFGIRERPGSWCGLASLGRRLKSQR